MTAAVGAWTGATSPAAAAVAAQEFGGAIFVREGGTLTIGAGSVGGGSVGGGDGNVSADTNTEGGDGQAAGTGLFLQGTGTLAFNPGTGQTATISDAIADEVGVVAGGYTPPSGYTPGSWSLNMTGSGTLILSGTNIYTGTTTVVAGLLQVDGSIANSATTVLAGATLGGNGTTGAVAVLANGAIGAGASAGILTTGDLALASGAFFEVEIGGTAAGPGGYDQVVVNGTVALGGATLDMTFLGNFVPTFGNSFTVIANDGADAVAGTFAGLAEGTQFIVDGRAYSITYDGGDGNDVVISSIQAVITGTSKGDLINGTNTIYGQLPATAAADIINGEGGNDRLFGLGGGDTIGGQGGADKLTGAAGNDSLSGNSGKDILKGGADDDWLDGGKGADKLKGGAGANAFVFSTKLGKKNVDKITDFDKGQDIIQLNSTIFKGIGGPGVLKAKYFAEGSAKSDDKSIVYRPGTGEILYDKNGSKAGGATLFATVDKNTVLDHTDFLVI